MSTDLEKSLRRIIGAVAFHSAETFSFAGRPSTQWSVPQTGPAPTGGNPAVQSLQSALYANCYTRVFTGSVEDPVAHTASNGDDWVESLSAANASKDRWEEGWRVQQFLPTGQINAQKGALTRGFWPGEFISRGGHGMAPQPGAPIAAFFPRESRAMQPGFYFAFGETPSAMEDEFPTVRYYWNVTRDCAAPLLSSLSAMLNKYQVPFRFKVVNHPGLLGRSDPALLYVGRRYYRLTAEIARQTHTQVASGLNDEVPLFTLPLAKGLAFAEDPGNQESFGMSRCRLLAEALWLAFSEGRTKVEDRLERVRQHFAAAGTSLERPYLNFASVDSYEFP
jgi:HopA1 effector protein family